MFVLQVTVRVHTENLSLTPYPFKIYPVSGLTGKNGVKYRGFVVTMRVHPVDLFGQTAAEGGRPRFNFKCFRKDHRTLIVEAPTIDASDAGIDDAVIRETLRNREDGETIIQGFVKTRTCYENLRTTGKMYWRLSFPPTVDLDETPLVIHQNMEGELKTEPLMVTGKIERLGEHSYAFPRIFWRIADRGQGAYRAAQMPPPPQEDDDAFAKAFIGGDGAI